jgi:hypothetical protein
MVYDQTGDDGSKTQQQSQQRSRQRARERAQQERRKWAQRQQRARAQASERALREPWFGSRGSSVRMLTHANYKAVTRARRGRDVWLLLFFLKDPAHKVQGCECNGSGAWSMPPPP